MNSTVIPNITVIIPCYNEEKHIELTLQSLIKNNYPNDFLEVLIIDGMSNDGTLACIIHES